MSEDSFPKAYKDGIKEFFGREFKVSPDVLIPRPETETMIEMVLSLAGRSYLPGVKVPSSVLPERSRILEVGTGSGCVAISLALELLSAEVVASDVSSEALAIARENAEGFGAKVKFVQSDLLKNVEGSFDVIVANLPYVDRSWNWISGVGHEPELALYAKNGGLELIFKLIEQAKDRTKYLILEADPCQHEKIISRAEAGGFKFLRVSGFQLLFIFGER